MQISYTGPLNRAWTRMKWMLFSPFNASKWFVIGFTAWLAVLVDSSTWGGNGGGPDTRARFDASDWEDTASSLAETIRDFLDHGLEIALVLMIVGLAIVFYVLCLWLSSRGIFMLLDNLVHNRAEVKAPWRQFGQLGDSLFVWRLVFDLICVLTIGPLIALAVLAALPLILHDDGGLVLSIAGFVVLGSLFFVLVVLAAFIEFFLIHLVAPIMYKHGVSANEAWRRFIPVLRQELGSFILYGLFYLLLWIVIGVAVIIFGLATCCFGFLLLAMPYIGTVLFLPVHVTFRTMDMEFLAQFGKDYDLVEGFAQPAT
jgi:hypothetical protein